MRGNSADDNGSGTAPALVLDPQLWHWAKTAASTLAAAAGAVQQQCWDRTTRKLKHAELVLIAMAQMKRLLQLLCCGGCRPPYFACGCSSWYGSVLPWAVLKVLQHAPGSSHAAASNAAVAQGSFQAAARNAAVAQGSIQAAASIAAVAKGSFPAAASASNAAVAQSSFQAAASNAAVRQGSFQVPFR